MKLLPNLLIVDDLAENIYLLEAILRNVKVKLIKAFSGEEALRKTQGLELALAIVDVRMPGMDGFELAVKINQQRPDNKVPVIFLTANNFSEIEQFMGYDSGAVDYMSKPIDNHILLCKINIFLDLYNHKQTIINNALALKASADELIRVNAALKKSEKRLSDIMFSMADWVWEVDENGIYTYSSNRGSDLLGISREEIIGKTMFDLMPPDEVERATAIFTEIMSSKAAIKDFESWNIGKNGERICLLTNGVPILDEEGNFKGYRGIDKDITERKCAEAAMRESEEKFRSVTQSANDAIITSNSKGIITDWNEGAEKIFGYTEYEITGKNLAVILPAQYRALYFENIEKVLNLDDFDVIGKTFEIAGLRKNGEEFPLELSLADWETDSGRFFTGIIRDITERRLAEQTLKVSEEKYRTMVNASPDGILLVDMDGIITEASEIALELLGPAKKDDLVGKRFHHFVPYDEKDTIREIFERTMIDGICQNIEIKIRKKNRSLFLSEISATLIQDADGQPLSVMIDIRDISHRKKMETKQIHADRMANLGEMASGIAHEINQPLNIISMVMDRILYETSKTETVDVEFLKGKSDKIFENIIRIRNIIDHVRDFSRSHENFVLTAFDINKTIENAVSMISEQFKHLGINLTLSLDSQIPPFVGNTFKFEQVIINLLTNAKDAVIEKRSRVEAYFEPTIQIKTSIEKFIITEIADNGSGIGDDILQNIMLPFFTTKEEGKGTGLGLSICYQIIKEMNGTIDVISDPVNGTIIKLIIEPVSVNNDIN